MYVLRHSERSDLRYVYGCLEWSAASPRKSKIEHRGLKVEQDFAIVPKIHHILDKLNYYLGNTALL